LQYTDIARKFRYLKILFTISVSILPFICSSQQLFWNQAEVFITDGAMLHVNGNLQSESSLALFVNAGDVRTENGYQNGDFVLTDSATVIGDGVYGIQGDWLNSAVYVADSSRVILEGNDEYIGGDSISYFFNLELRGSGVKTQLIDAFTTNELALNDRELAIDSFSMTVTNSRVSSVTSDSTLLAEGFASTLVDGRLVRQMDHDSTYVFPMGSSVGFTRYRPVDLKPNGASGETFSVGFNNYDATVNGHPVILHDSIVCRINDQYYHLIEHNVGMASADLTMYYHPADGHFDQIAQWDTLPTGQWKVIGNDSQLSAGYQTIQVDSVSDFTPIQFALAVLTPSAPAIVGDTVVCDSNLLWTYEVIPSNAGSVYYWDIPTDAMISSGSGTDVIDVDWLSSSGGEITVYEIDTNGCQSFPGTTNVNLFPSLSADFDTTGSPLYGLFEFGNYSIGADGYFWNFGDGNTSVDENPTHQYELPGLYEVVLTAENSFGCTSKDTLWIEVIEGIDIPNVFSPNGDGNNDFFYANSIGMTEKSISIFNRWGKEIYYSSKLDFAWDGTNIWSGLPASEGTYFYVIKARSVTREYEYSGALMLHR